MTEYKILFLGDPAVGKTSIINRIIDQPFYNYYEPSDGISEIIYNDIGIYDVAGKDYLFNNLDDIKKIILELKINLIVYVYDCQNHRSYRNLIHWKKCNINKNIPYILIANKAEGNDGEIYSNNLKMNISARDNKNIDHIKNIIISHKLFGSRKY